MARFRYAASHEPPAPVVPARLSSLRDRDEVRVLSLLVDTGADCTCVPETLVRSLALPLIERAAIAGVGGTIRRVTIHEAALVLGGHEVIAPVVALDDEAILGRDILRRFVLTLDGPQGRLQIEPPKKK